MGCIVVYTTAFGDIFFEVRYFESVIENRFGYASLAIFIFVEWCVVGRCGGIFGSVLGDVFLDGFIVGIVCPLLTGKAEYLTGWLNKLNDRS